MFSNLIELLDDILQKYSDKPALLFEPGFKYVSSTYRHLPDDSKKAAKYFESLGLIKGHRVIIWGPDSPILPAGSGFPKEATFMLQNAVDKLSA